MPEIPEKAAYKAVERDIRKRIESGEWPEGEKIPGRSVLAAEYGVAVNTVQRALKPLLELGVLTSSNKRGTYVSYDGSAKKIFKENVEFNIAVIAWECVDGQTQDLTGRPWNFEIMRCFEAEARTLGAKVEFYNAHLMPGDYFRDPAPAFKKAVAGKPDAILVLNINVWEKWASFFVQQSRKLDIPLLYIGGGQELGLPFPSIVWDNFSCGYDAASHMVDQGCENIKFFRCGDYEWNRERSDGCFKAIVDAGLPEDCYEDILLSGHENKGGLEEVRECFSEILKSGVTASSKFGFIGQNDTVALELIEMAEKFSVVPGEDAGFMGFDNMFAALNAGLTTMALPIEDFGKTSAGLLVSRLRGGVLPLRTLLKWQLYPRTSTAFRNFRAGAV